MREIVGLIAILPFITWLLTHKRYKDIAAPYNLFTFLYIINIMLPIFTYINIDSTSTIRESYIRKAISSDSIFCEYVVLQTICYYLVIFGTKLRIRKSSENLEEYNTYSEENVAVANIRGQEKYKYIGIVIWAIGFVAFIKIMNQVGGIYYFFTHLQFRTSLTRDIDFWSWLLPFVDYGVLFIIYSYKGTEKRLNIKIILLIIISGLMSGLGGRKDLIILFIEALLLYHYTIKKIDIKRFFKMRYILLVIALYLFFVLMSKFRTEGAAEAFLQNPLAFTKDSSKGIFETIQSESYVSFFMTIIDYFKTHALWLGRSFIGLVTAIIPSSLYPGKPPVDDGTYLYSICQGRSDIVPPMPFSQLNGSSYPLETFGSMYGNFGLMGLFLGMIVLGGIYGYAYRKMKKNSYDLFSVVIYTQIIFTFQLSTLRFFQLFEIIVVLKIITAVVNRQISWGGVQDYELINCIYYGITPSAIIIKKKIKTVHNTLKKKSILSTNDRIMNKHLIYNSLNVGGQLS